MKEKIASVNGAYQTVYANLAEALAGQASPSVSADEALVTTEIIQTAFRSSQNQQLEQLF